MVTKNDDETVWELTLPAASIQGFNGKVQLTVKAIDKNNHSDGEVGGLGGDLDGTPATPARRNMLFGGDQYNPVRNFYPWHKDLGAAPGSNDAKFSYDPEEGDTNHVLLFDVLSPSAVITIDTVLPN